MKVVEDSIIGTKNKTSVFRSAQHDLFKKFEG
jgi:hypothetical protein